MRARLHLRQHVAEDLADVLRVVVAEDPERPQEVEGGGGNAGERVVGDLVADEPPAARLGTDPAAHVLEVDGVHLAARHVLEDCARPRPAARAQFEHLRIGGDIGQDRAEEDVAIRRADPHLLEDPARPRDPREDVAAAVAFGEEPSQHVKRGHRCIIPRHHGARIGL